MKALGRDRRAGEGQKSLCGLSENKYASRVSGCSLARNTYFADGYGVRWVFWGGDYNLFYFPSHCVFGDPALWLGARFQSQTVWVQILFRASLCVPR